VHDALAAIAVAVPELSYDEICQRWEIFHWLSRATDALPPRQYREDVLLISAVDDDETQREWDAAIDGRVTRETVGGDHYRIVERPIVERVAAAMDRAIGAAGAVRR
jgi:thioesterase domain-containing protein